MRSRAALLAGLAAGLLAAAPVRAAPVQPMPARLDARGGRVVASVDLGAAFAPALEKELGNGLTNVVAVWVALLPEHGGDPVLVHGRLVEILFDVWDETYAVTVKDRQRPAGGRRVVADWKGLRALLADERDLDLGGLDDLPPGPFVLEARVEVNPVSREQLQRTREYLAAGGAHAGGGSRSVLGAVASFLLRDPDPGTDIFRLRSRPFTRGEVAAR